LSDIVFGTDGWRDVMCERFNFYNFRLVVQAVSNYLKERFCEDISIFIGYDTRFFSKDFAKCAAEILSANGIKVLLPKRAMPTPITAYAIKAFNTKGALMITASHNPYRYNGVKFIAEYSGPATSETTSAIESHLSTISDSDVKSDCSETLIKYVDPINDYINHISELLNVELLLEKKLKVVVDPMYGAASGIIEKILNKFGCQVVPVCSGLDNPYFGGVLPDPSVPDNIEPLINALKKENAALGLALDGDADRFGAVDSTFKFIAANQILAIIADYLIKVRRLKGAVVRSVATTGLLDAIANKNGVQLIETPVGFKYVGEQMRQGDVILGGEESAGLSILGHIPEKDGILAVLLLAEITAYWGKPLSEVLDNLWDTYGHFTGQRLDVHLSDAGKARLIEHFNNSTIKEIAGLKVLSTVKIDGIKLVLDGGSWLLVRPSGTESLVRIYFESPGKNDFAKIKKYADDVAQKYS